MPSSAPLRLALPAHPLSLAVGYRSRLHLDALSSALRVAGLEIRHTATTTERLIGLCEAEPADLALVHAELDPAAPLGFVAPLREAAPDMPIVVLLDELDPPLAYLALAEAVEGIVLGCTSVAELLPMLRRVAVGDAVYPAGWLTAARRAGRESIDGLLSQRQRDVLQLVAAGLGNGDIALRLNISPNTVKFHVRHIYQRLGVSNRVEATLLLQQRERGFSALAGSDAPLPERVGPSRSKRVMKTTRSPVSVRPTAT